MATGSRVAIFSRHIPGGVYVFDDIAEHPNDIFFVDSTHSNAADKTGWGTSPDEPFATIDHANGLCTANKKDVIVCMPGHTETISEAAAIALDTAGVTLIGLGNGNNRPTITFDTATDADLDIDAADITIENFRFIGGIASLAAPIDVNAARFTMRNCDFMSSGAGYGVLISIITAAAANDMTIENCNFQYLVATDGTTAITETSTEAIRLVGADRAVIKDCYFSGDFTTSVINGITTASKDIKLIDNTIYNIATENIAGAIDLVAACTGVIDGNTCHVAYASSAAALIDGSSCVLGINYVNNATGEAPAVHGTAETIGVEAKIDVIDGYHDVPTADTTDNAQVRDVVGNKSDAAAAGAVTTQESLIAYTKQLVGGQIIIDAFHDVPTADTTDNVVISDVVGNKSDAAAAGAVTTTESLMAYVKQNVGAIITIDAFHDVPTADTTDNAQVRDVVGNKSDAAAAGAVTTTESLMAYVKQNVGALITVDGYHDVPTADTTDNAQVRDVVGNKTDAAADGVVSTTESLVAYIKQLVGQDKGIARHTITFTAGGDGSVGAHDLFTVTGTVRIRVLAVCTTNLAIQTGATIEVGISGTTDAFIAQTAGDDPDAGEIWHDATPDASIELDSVYSWQILANSTDVIYTVGTDTIDSGVMEFYAEWERLSADGNVVAA